MAEANMLLFFDDGESSAFNGFRVVSWSEYKRINEYIPQYFKWNQEWEFTIGDNTFGHRFTANCTDALKSKLSTKLITVEEIDILDKLLGRTSLNCKLLDELLFEAVDYFDALEGK